jgi:hypothetical protein
MSMSTLGAQLAAINAPGKNVGTALPTSRRHEDAVGRGLSHSVQLGHSMANKSHLHKPSIIYEDSRKASDVPLATIRENCVSSLRQLESVDPEFGQFVEKLCKTAQERGLGTSAENTQIDGVIQDLLYRLALRLSSKTMTASCLHVIEFLLRRYDLHVRPKLAATALLVLLPHHEEPYFLRLLQLIDLASVATYAFLRPYAAPNAKVGRDVFVKQASKDTALLREICRLAQRQSTLPNSGLSLSFTAAVLVEAMALQQRTTGSLDERTCMTLLPFIVKACRQSSAEGFQNWGHVLASTVVETCVLAEEPQAVLVTSILQGLAGAATNNNAIISNGLVVALTILAQPLDGVDVSAFQLPMVVKGGGALGVTMDKNVLLALLKVDNIAARLGQLYATEGFVDFAQWIASILVVGWKRLQKKKEGKRYQKVQDLIISLIQEPRLHILWSNDWVESFACFVLTNTTPLPEANSEEETFMHSILQALRKKNTVAYEQGLTQALIRTPKEERGPLATWLGLQTPVPGNPSEAESIQLPPRVALEHADVEVRLDAIPLVLEEGGEDAMEVDDGESVQEALLRRVILDDNAQVALKAAEGLVGLLDKKPLAIGALPLAEGCLQAFYKWTERSNVDKKLRSLLVVQALRMVAHAAKTLSEDDDLRVRLIESLGAYVTNSDKIIGQEATKLICRVFKGKKGKASEKDARDVLVSDKDLLADYRRKIDKASRTEQAIRRRCLPTMLKAFSESLAQRSKKEDSFMAQEAVDYCVWAVEAFSKDLKEDELDLLTECLSKTAIRIASTTERIPSIFALMAETESKIFSKVLAPFIQAVCDHVTDKKNGKVAGIAVVMEVALGTPSSQVIENLITVASQIVQSENNAGQCHHGFAPAFALLAHGDESVREKVVDLICSMGESFSKQPKSEWSSLNEICQYISNNRSSAIMGGVSFLPGCLTAVMSVTKKADALQKSLLSLCVYSAVACGSAKSKSPENAFDHGWLDIGEVIGGQKAAVTILKVAESSGEDAFPLATRWHMAGKPILDAILKATWSKGELPSSLSALVDSVVRMLKGVRVMDPTSLLDSTSNVIIMSGPASRGGRARSYSFGKSDGFNFLEPYPKEMHGSIASILNISEDNSLTRKARNSLSESILSSQSWGQGVFMNLTRTVRQKIAASVLAAATQDLADGAEEALFSLPLDPIDIAELLEKQAKSKLYLPSITYIADFASANSQQLIGDSSVSDLFAAFFKHLSSLSSKTTDEDESTEFARQSILSALNELLVAASDSSSSKLGLDKNKNFSDWINLLGSILGGDEKSKVQQLESTRSKKTTISLLTLLCSMYPSSVVEKLIPAMVAIVSNSTSQKEASVSAECFGSIIPAYFKHSSAARLSPAELFNAFIAASNAETDESTKVQLYQGFVDSLSKISDFKDTEVSAVGALVSACLAGEVHFALLDDSSDSLSLAQLATQMMRHTNISTKVSAVWTMLAYAKDLIVQLMDGESPSTKCDILSLEELTLIAKYGPKNRNPPPQKRTKSAKNGQDVSLFKLCNALLVAVCDTVSAPSFRKFARQAKGDTSTLILRLWQDLLLVQSACHNHLGGSSAKDMGAFWGSIGEITNETLDSLQSHLPSHIFLAFATSLIKEGGTEELRARAVQLVADRSLSLEAADPEAALFRDMLPFLTALLKIDGDGKVLRQSALVAIEHIARALCVSADTAAIGTGHLEQLALAVARSADMIEAESTALKKNSASGFGDIDNASRQLVCSAALCAATTIRVCGPRALPALPKLMKPLIAFLSAANASLSSNVDNRMEVSQAKLMQLSVLRTLSSVAETLPQFLAPYLGSLFAPLAFPSEWLRKEHDDQSLSVKAASERLSGTIASRVPARQLIPATSNALVNTKESAGVLALLSILTASVKESKGPELAGQINMLLKAATFVFDFSGGTKYHGSLVDASNQLLLSLILKLSEVQLRSLYAKLREWRGGFDKSDPTISASRRVAFWGLSSCLGKQLKSIYLPCLSTVFSDAVDELVSTLPEERIHYLIYA